MPFAFSFVCDLLQRIDNNLHARSGQRNNATITVEWFEQHRSRFRHENFDGSALLSTLLPEKRTDRVYFIGARTLQRQIGRALCLRRSRISELTRWEQPGSGVDLGDCVERILTTTPNAIHAGLPRVSVEDIDDLLHGIASGCRFSSSTVKKSCGTSGPLQASDVIAFLYKRVTAEEGKWLTRLILKDYSPVVLDEYLVYKCYHALLPVVLKIQYDFKMATSLIKTLERSRGVIQGPLPQAELLRHVKPALGVQIGRQPFLKARSLKHCLEMGRGQMSCEHKVDGEYCQIHIDLAKGLDDCLKIFSKSGKESTRDRAGVHKAIRSSLRLGQPDCPFRSGCILEAEMVVYSDLTKGMLDFHTIRKYVTRSGVIMGQEMDSQRHEWEHLMIVYFDVLMVDGESLLACKRSERFGRLTRLVSCEPGHAEIVRREVIDFDGALALSDLRRAFARSIAKREEGLVLKTNDAYFDFSPVRQPYGSCAIKLKKEYIGNFGDIGDFAVVGARYDAARAKEYEAKNGIRNLKWTHFYIACLENKEEVERRRNPPAFVVTNVVELNATQLRALVHHVSPNAVPPAESRDWTARFPPGLADGQHPSVYFTEPPIVDVRCHSFEMAKNIGFWAPRFPVVNKLQFERSYHDIITFNALQKMAKENEKKSAPDDSQEVLKWIEELENIEPEVVLSDAMTQSQSFYRSFSTAPLSPQTTSHIPITATNPQESPPVTGAHSVELALAFQPLSPPRSSPCPAPLMATVGEHQKPGGSSRRALKRRGGSPIKPERAAKAQKCVHQATPSSPAPRESISTPASSFGRVLADITDMTQNSQQHVDLINGLPALAPLSRQSAGGSEPRRVRESAAAASAASQVRADTETCLGSTPAAFPSGSPDTPSSLTLGKCRYRGDACMLRKYAIVLAPCIAQYSWLTEDLLRSHGKSFIVDPARWKNKVDTESPRDLPAMTASLQPERCSVRKLALVERRRGRAMTEFLERIGLLTLTRPDGNRDWVNVLDWRFLEELTEEEKKSSRHGGVGTHDGHKVDQTGVQSIWRKHWIGLA